MSSAALLDADFGSESEDDNFNPAPASESDNEGAGDSNDELSSKQNGNDTDQRRRTSGDERNRSKDHGPTKGTSQRNGNLASGQIGDEADENGDAALDGSDAENGNGAAGDEEDDEDEDDDDDEDEEEDISVCQSQPLRAESDMPNLRLRVARESELVEIPETNTLMLKPKLTKKMRVMKRTKKDRQIHSSPTHIRMTLQTFRSAQISTIDGIGNSIVSAT